MHMNTHTCLSWDLLVMVFSEKVIMWTHELNSEALSSPNEWNEKQNYTGHRHACVHACTQRETLTHRNESRL